MWIRNLIRLTALLLLTAPVPAWACGGFFCNFQDPVNQIAERILYVQEKAKVTVHIQIKYKGPADKFSWVLPLQKLPTLGIGSDSVFSALEQSTKPVFYLQQESVPGCYLQNCMYPTAGGVQDSASADAGTNDGGVKILLHEAVGPYDSTVIQGSDGKVVKKWLDDNGYSQPPGTEVLLDSYAKKDFVFLALKLQKDKADGDLAPIVVTLAEIGPCLPIRLTAVAAEPDMPIVAWVLAEHRAIPKNFMHVELNEKTIDWMTGGGNYLSVVSKAVDQASGHAFTTEYAGKSSIMQNQFAQAQWNTAALEKFADPGEFLNAMLGQGIPRTSQVQALIKKYIPKPAGFEGQSDQEFYGCVQAQCDPKNCGGTCTAVKQAIAGQAFDAKALAKALQDGVVKPLQEVQKSFDLLPYLTRLFTLVSPSEMTKDPIFGFNPDLPEVSQQHTAKALPICESGKSEASQVKITVADGSSVTLAVPKLDPSSCWQFGGQQGDGKGLIVTAGGQPAKSVAVLDESGAAYAVEPMASDKVDAELNNAELGKPSLSAAFKATLPPITWNADKAVVTGADAGSSDGTGADASGDSATLADAGGTTTTAKPAESSGCTASPVAGTASAISLLLAIAGLALLRRRFA